MGLRLRSDFSEIRHLSSSCTPFRCWQQPTVGVRPCAPRHCSPISAYDAYDHAKQWVPPRPQLPTTQRGTFSGAAVVLQQLQRAVPCSCPRGLKACGLCFGLSHFCRVQFRYRIITVNHNFR